MTPSIMTGRICVYRQGTEWRYSLWIDDRRIDESDLSIGDDATQAQAIEAARALYAREHSGAVTVTRIGDRRER